MKYLDLWFVKSLPWPIHGSIISFNLNIFLSQYLLCVKMSRVNKALMTPNQNWHHQTSKKININARVYLQYYLNGLFYPFIVLKKGGAAASLAWVKCF